MCNSEEQHFKTISVTIEIDVPVKATDEDIEQWIDVEYGECNSMKSDNPCIDDYEVMHVEWRHS